jgi:membrane protease YdiL (CAAX protease family)
MNPDRNKTNVYSAGQLLLFFVLSFAITWAILIPTLRFVPEDGQILFIIFAAFGPFLSAVIVIRGHNGKTALREWLRTIFRFRIPALLYLAGAFLLPIVFGGFHYLLYRLFGGSPDFENAIPWYQYLAYLIPTALLTGGNEEPGWRGFALPALLKWFHPVIASLILGSLHSLWHLPLMDHYGTNMGWYLFNLIPLTFLFNWFYLVSRKSIIPVMLFHASTNVLSSFIPTPDVVLNGIGTNIFIRSLAYWILAITLLIYTRGRLGYSMPTKEVASSYTPNPTETVQ